MHPHQPHEHAGTPKDPSQIGGDPAALDTPADQAGGALGMLANLLRVLFARFLPPWFYPPPSFRAFDIQTNTTVATPAVGTSSIVLESLVPTGFSRVIRGLSINLIGPGFVQGSGTMVFQVTVDNAPVKGYGQVTTELGSVQFPRITYGILANSGQTVRIIASNIGYVAGGTNVIGSIVGYDYPKQRGQQRRS